MTTTTHHRASADHIAPRQGRFPLARVMPVACAILLAGCSAQPAAPSASSATASSVSTPTAPAPSPTPTPTSADAALSGTLTVSNTDLAGYTFAYSAAIPPFSTSAVTTKDAPEVGKSDVGVSTSASFSVTNTTPGDRPFQGNDDQFAFELFAIYPASSLMCRGQSIDGQGCIRGAATLAGKTLGATSDGTVTGESYPDGQRLTASPTIGVGYPFETGALASFEYTTAELPQATSQIVAPSGYGVAVWQNTTPALKFNEAKCDLPGNGDFETTTIVAQTGPVSICG